MLKNLCLPTGGCSHRCDQGRDCEGSRTATCVAIGLPNLAPARATPCDCFLKLASCPIPEACHVPIAEAKPVDAKPARRWIEILRSALPF